MAIIVLEVPEGHVCTFQCGCIGRAKGEILGPFSSEPRYYFDIIFGCDKTDVHCAFGSEEKGGGHGWAARHQQVYVDPLANGLEDRFGCHSSR